MKTIPEGAKLRWDKLNKYMEKAGVPQFDFDSFKAVYDQTPELQELVKFGPDGVKIYASSADKLPQGNPDKAGDDVEKMAKRATDLGD